MRHARAAPPRAASPRTSRAGWIAAQCGVYVPPSTSRRAAPLARLGGVEQPQVVVAEAERAGLVDRRPGPARAAPACARAPPCRPWPSGSRSPRRRRPGPTSSTVACIARCIATAAVPAVPAGQRGQRGGEQRRAPAAVAAGRAVPGDLASRRPRRAATGRRRPGSTPSTARCSRRRRSPRRRRCRRAAPGRGVRSSSTVDSQNDSPGSARFTSRCATPRSARCAGSAPSRRTGAGRTISGGASCTTGSPRSSARQ